MQFDFLSKAETLYLFFCMVCQTDNRLFDEMTIGIRFVSICSCPSVLPFPFVFVLSTFELATKKIPDHTSCGILMKQAGCRRCKCSYPKNPCGLSMAGVGPSMAGVRAFLGIGEMVPTGPIGGSVFHLNGAFEVICLCGWSNRWVQAGNVFSCTTLAVMWLQYLARSLIFRKIRVMGSRGESEDDLVILSGVDLYH